MTRHRTTLTRRLLPLLTVGGILLLMLSESPLAVASTSVTPFRASPVALAQLGPPTAPRGITVLSETLVRITPTSPGATTVAGRQTAGTVGQSGTTTRIAACLAGPCTHQYRPAGAAGLRSGHWAIEVRLTVLQPSARLGTARGFGVEVALNTGSTWFAAWGYFSTGTSRAATNQTINLNLWIDLGTTVRPASVPVIVLVDSCRLPTGCP